MADELVKAPLDRITQSRLRKAQVDKACMLLVAVTRGEHRTPQDMQILFGQCVEYPEKCIYSFQVELAARQQERLRHGR